MLRFGACHCAFVFCCCAISRAFDRTQVPGTPNANAWRRRSTRGHAHKSCVRRRRWRRRAKQRSVIVIIRFQINLTNESLARRRNLAQVFLPKNVLAYVLARSSTLFAASSLDPTCQSVWPETRLKMSSTIRPHNNWRAGRGNGAQLFVRGRHHYPQRAHVGVQSLQAFENPSVVIQKTRRGHRVPASGRACASFEGVEIVPSEVRARCHLVRSRSAHWQWADVASSELSTAGPACSHVVLRSPLAPTLSANAFRSKLITAREQRH